MMKIIWSFQLRHRNHSAFYLVIHSFSCFLFTTGSAILFSLLFSLNYLLPVIIVIAIFLSLSLYVEINKEILNNLETVTDNRRQGVITANYFKE